MRIRLLFSGDFSPMGNSENLYSDELLEVLKDKDFSIVNLECPLTHSEIKITKTGHNFKSDPSNIINLCEAHFDAAALSNNHILDYGPEGVIETLETCKTHCIKTLGAGIDKKTAAQPLQITIKNKKICFFNYSEPEFQGAKNESAGGNTFDLIDAYYQIRKAKKENDYIIILYHGGLENQYYPSLEMVKNLKFLIDSGSDAVIAHHTHRYSGVITYKDKPIFFGLGNFFSKTNSKNKKEWRFGIIAKIYLQYDAIDYELIPTEISEDFSTVGLLTGERKNEVITHIHEISKNIEDEQFIKSYWDEEYLKRAPQIIRSIKSKSRNEYKLRKYFPWLFKRNLTNYQLLYMHNLIRCPTHRESLLHIFDHFLQIK